MLKSLNTKLVTFVVVWLNLAVAEHGRLKAPAVGPNPMLKGLLTLLMPSPKLFTHRFLTVMSVTSRPNSQVGAATNAAPQYPISGHETGEPAYV